jgi:pyruvate dehydrogenase E2 component (dihydrolipoamide acetyltransferase)
MKTVYYHGPYEEGVDIPLPNNGEGVHALPGEPVDVPDEIADGLLVQEDIWSTSPDGPVEAPEVPAPSKSARELAEQLNVDLGQIEGSGKDGRIVVADVKAAAQTAGTPAPPEQPPGEAGEENQPESGATEEE